MHYWAFKAGTDWELDTDYELLNDEARDLTHDPNLLPSNFYTAKLYEFFSFLINYYCSYSSR